MRAQPLNRAKDEALCLKLPLVSFIVCANGDGSGETAQMHPAWKHSVKTQLSLGIQSDLNLCCPHEEPLGL